MYGGKRNNYSPIDTLKFLLLAQRKRCQGKRKTAGFTLIEILVALIIAALIITPLLGFMIGILRTDQQEQAKATSEQELQAAADYISRDLQQAVYIYDQDGVNAISGEIPSASDRVPVLVFWKRKFIPDALPFDSSAAASTCPTNCNDAFVYALVAYYLINDGGSGNSWSATSRIARFEIQDGVRKADGTYLDQGGDRVGRDQGFQFVLSDLPGETLRAKLQNWENSGETYAESPDVLIDYIDQTETDPNLLPEDSHPTEACPSNANPANNDPGWQQVPDYSDSDVDDKFKTHSFYTCVWSQQNTAKVFLRGNALARIQNNVPPKYSEETSSFFPTAKIEVTGSGKLSQNF